MSIRWSQQQYNLYLEYTHLLCIYLHTQAFLRNQSSYEIKCVLKTKIQEIFLDSQFPSFPLLTIIMLSTSFKSENIRILGLKLSQSRSCGHSDGLSPMPVTFTCVTAPPPAPRPWSRAKSRSTLCIGAGLRGVSGLRVFCVQCVGWCRGLLFSYSQVSISG